MDLFNWRGWSATWQHTSCRSTREGGVLPLAEASLHTCAPSVIPVGYLKAAPWVTYPPLPWILNLSLSAGLFSLACKHSQCPQSPMGGAGPGIPTHQPILGLCVMEPRSDRKASTLLCPRTLHLHLMSSLPFPATASNRGLASMPPTSSRPSPPHHSCFCHHH